MIISGLSPVGTTECDCEGAQRSGVKVPVRTQVEGFCSGKKLRRRKPTVESNWKQRASPQRTRLCEPILELDSVWCDGRASSVIAKP